MPASAIEHDANERRGPWWGWSDVKRTLEWMFRTGEVVCVERRRFERVYALPEQALPVELLDSAPAEPDAIRELLLRFLVDVAAQVVLQLVRILAFESFAACSCVEVFGQSFLGLVGPRFHRLERLGTAGSWRDFPEIR